MGIKVSADGLSIVTTKSGGTCNATVPDVCNIPGPNGPIPVPFPNIAESKKTQVTSVMTQMNGGNVACFGSYCEPSSGDEGGIMGGVASGGTKGKATFLLSSPTVMVESRPVCRKSDLMIMNEFNTVGLAGMNQEDVGSVEGEDEEKELIKVKFKISFHEEENNEDNVDQPFKLFVLGQKVTEGTVTNEEQELEFEIPKHAKSGILKIGEKKVRQTHEVIFDEFPEGKKGTQAKLSNLGYYDGRTDNYIGPKSENALARFQRDSKIKMNGKPGGQTDNELDSLV